MYSTNDTKKIKEIHDFILPLQKSDEGWDLGLLLLQQESLSCKYFGALTTTVFVNTYTSQLKELTREKWKSMIDQLLDHIHQLFGNNQASFVIKKIISNLQLIFLNFYQEVDLIDITGTLSNPLLITFYTILAQDLSKLNISNELHLIIHKNFAHVINLFHNSPNESIINLLECINSWFIYISIAEQNSPEQYSDEELAPLIDFLLNQFQVHDMIERMEINNQSFQVLTELLETCPKFLIPFKTVVSSILFSENQFGSYFISHICLDEDKAQEYMTEIGCFVNLLISYLTNNLPYISRNLLNPDVENMLSIALGLSDFKGDPVADEVVSEQFLIFWEEFLNYYIDDEQVLKETLKEKYPDFLELRNKLLTRLSMVYWQKSKFFNGAPKLEFSHYRSQISDLFLVLYQLLNTDLYSLFTQSIILELENQKSSVNIETSLYLLFKITDDLTFYDDDSTEKLVPFIESMFQNNLISVFDNSEKYAQVNITLLNFLSSIHFYFRKEPGSHRLPETFNFLFAIILGVPSNDIEKSLSLVSSKTVLKICQDSQQSLIAFLPDLQKILNEMILNVEVDSLIRERMTNAFISIAMSMKNPSSMGNIMNELIQSITNVSNVLVEDPASLVSTFHNLLSEEVSEKLETYATSMLACINEMGKATQLPEDVGDYYTDTQVSEVNEYWNNDKLGIKQAILICISQYSLNLPGLANNTLITEKFCCILKSGLCEIVNGPFKFLVNNILEYLAMKFERCTMNSVPYIHKLLETVVITNHKTLSSTVSEAIISNFFLKNEAAFSEDVEVVRSLSDLFCTIIEHNPALLIDLASFHANVLPFELKALKHHETFVTRSVTKFWSAVITLRKGNHATQEVFKLMMVNNNGHFGQVLLEYLMVAFSTNHRSNLDSYYPIFRNLIGKYPLQLKPWLKHALLANCIKEGRFDANDVDNFIAKLMLTRGQRQANDVLKKFWLQVNGLKDY